MEEIAKITAGGFIMSLDIDPKYRAAKGAIVHANKQLRKYGEITKALEWEDINEYYNGIKED